MNSIRNVAAAGLLAGAALLAAAGVRIASAADDAATSATAPDEPMAGPDGRGAWHHGWGPGRMYAKLGLSAEQRDSIKAIMTAARPQMQSLHAQARENHLKMMQTTPDDPNYATVVAAVAETNAALASQRTTQMSQIKAKIYELLTPPQKTQLASLEAQWAANPHGGRE